MKLENGSAHIHLSPRWTPNEDLPTRRVPTALAEELLDRLHSRGASEREMYAAVNILRELLAAAEITPSPAAAEEPR